ncbi:MAG: V-type ATPase subunit subunit G family protein [Coriobacteriia bacterium]|nr:V-type ATPase subunit subunit G family protein [Coriobacteriia bacterium]
MDEKVLEEIKFHQGAAAKDASSPLFQIREKEMEISGRVFAARSQADKMVTDARQRSVETVRTAHADADRLAKEHAEQVLAGVDDSIAEVKAEGAEEVERLKKELAMRQSDAADFLVKIVVAV